MGEEKKDLTVNTKTEVEEIIAKFDEIDIPFGIEAELAKNITDAFDKAGIYYHVLTRIKERDSIKRKLEKKYEKYKSNNKEKKMQDLIGIKFLFYFVDDLKIALKIVYDIYKIRPDDISSTKTTKDSFAATNRNYVVEIPFDILDRYGLKDKLAACMIDDTFEIQFKTMFFHGWHETEHDLRYKNEELWRMHGDSMYRKLNRVLGSLELCDDTLVGVFDKLAYRTYLAVRNECKKYKNEKAYRVDPLVLEKLAQAHFRLKMSMEFHAPKDARERINKRNKNQSSSDEKIDAIDALIESNAICFNKSIYSNKVKKGFIKDMELYFTCCLETVLYRENVPDYKSKAKKLAQKALKTFLSVDFLRIVEKYNRARLIDGFRKYKNYLDIDIYNICAMIYTDNSDEEEQDKDKNIDKDPELVKYLKKHLIGQYKSSKAICKSKVRKLKEKEKNPDSSSQNNNQNNNNQNNKSKSYSPIKVKRYKEYPTYQCYADVFSKENSETTEELFHKVFKYVAGWMDKKFDTDESSDARTKLKRYAEGKEKIDIDSYNEPLLETKGYDFRVLYLKEERTCAFRLTEPDNQYEKKRYDNMLITASNRTFITDVSIKMVGEGHEGHVELAVRTLCKEPVGNFRSADAFRTGFISKLYTDSSLVVTEHGSLHDYYWQDNKKDIHKQTTEEIDLLLNNPDRQLPVVVISEKVMNENPGFGIAPLTSSLSGYGYVVVEKESEEPEIRICYPEKFPEPNEDKKSVGPEYIDENNNNDDELTYVYAWQKISDIVKDFTVDKTEFSFGGVKLYRKLKDAYYTHKDESVENLKKRVENLERALNELGG